VLRVAGIASIPEQKNDEPKQKVNSDIKELNDNLLFVLKNAPRLNYRPNIEMLNRVASMAKREVETMLAEEQKQRAAEDESQETNYPET